MNRKVPSLEELKLFANSNEQVRSSNFRRLEVPVLASRQGFEPINVGALPPSCAILTALSAQTEMMAVEGCLRGDAGLVYRAIAHDPLTAAKLSLSETRKMVAEMFRRNRRYLPQFKRIDL